MKTWLTNNLMAIIIAGLVTAFFIDFQVFKTDVKDLKTQVETYESRLYVLEVITIIQNPNLTEQQKMLLLNLHSRGIDVSKYTK